MMWRGETSGMPDFRIGSYGIKLLLQPTIGTITAREGFTGDRPADKAHLEGSFFTLNITMWLYLRWGVTTTGWIRSGGMNSGWGGRWMSTTPRLPMWIMPINCRGMCFW